MIYELMETGVNELKDLNRQVVINAPEIMCVLEEEVEWRLQLMSELIDKLR